MSALASCRCGAMYALADWLALEWCGIQDDGEGGSLELRQCGCHSTLSIDGLAIDRLATEIETLKTEALEASRTAHDVGDQTSEGRAFIAKARLDQMLWLFFEEVRAMRSRRSGAWRALVGVHEASTSPSLTSAR